MLALKIGVFLWLVWFSFYLYDISHMYSGRFRIKSSLLREQLVWVFYTSLALMCVGTYWLWMTWLVSLIVS